MNTPSPAPESSAGPVIATIIILAVIVLGGLYFWGQRSADMNPQETAPAQTVDNTTSAIESQSSSDDTNSIDADLRSTDTTSVDGSIQSL